MSVTTSRCVPLFLRQLYHKQRETAHPLFTERGNIMSKLSKLNSSEKIISALSIEIPKQVIVQEIKNGDYDGKDGKKHQWAQIIAIDYSDLESIQKGATSIMPTPFVIKISEEKVAQVLQLKQGQSVNITELGNVSFEFMMNKFNQITGIATRIK